MIKFLLTLLLILPASAQAQEIKIDRRDKKIFLSGPGCVELLKEAGLIQALKSKKNEKIDSKLCVCEDGCKIEVTEILPKKILKQDMTCSIKNGPNCWNSSLVTSGILHYERYTEPEEMNFWMNSPLCKERLPEEALEPGDVIAVRENSGAEVHGFINISENISYSKNGFRKGTEYSLMSPKEVFEVYEVPLACQRIYKYPLKPDECPNYASYFKCDSMDEYLKKNPIKDTEEAKTWYTLDDLDCELSGLAFKSVFDTSAADLMLVSIRAIKTLAESKIDSAQISLADKFIWNAIRVKSLSLIEQIGML